MLLNQIIPVILAIEKEIGLIRARCDNSRLLIAYVSDLKLIFTIKSGNIFTTIVKLTSNPVTVEPAAIDFKASIGGTAEDYFSGIDTDKDGNYITANVTNSKDGDFKEFAELKYAAPYTVLVKYDKTGNVKWRKPIGSPRGTLQIMDILFNEDGTFYAIGYGKNVGGKNGKGYYDGVVFKFDKDGNELWYKNKKHNL